MKKLLLVGTALLGTMLTGCAAGNGYAVVRFGPPPPPRYGVMGFAPGPGYVWTDGYYDWRGGRWFWWMAAGCALRAPTPSGSPGPGVKRAIVGASTADTGDSPTVATPMRYQPRR